MSAVRALAVMFALALVGAVVLGVAFAMHGHWAMTVWMAIVSPLFVYMIGELRTMERRGRRDVGTVTR